MMATAFIGNYFALDEIQSYENLSNLPFLYVKKYENLHTTQTQLLIVKENRQKSGIYLIYNNMNDKFYIGSAITNRINVRFRNHCIHQTGSTLLCRAIKKYGLENFSFFILEYYPGFIHKENLKSAHLKLLSIETKYINQLNPVYNILTLAGSSIGYLHNVETIEKMKANYSEERRIRIGNLNKNKSLSQSQRDALSLSLKLK
jgi:group I intron endonuclease